MNQYYSEELSQKTKRGLHETRLKGHFVGGLVNYGYSLVPVLSDGKQIASKLAINEAEAAVVRELFSAYASGKPVARIADDLNARGLLFHGKPFKPCSLYMFLRRETYTGIYRVNGRVYDGIYPKIIEPELYARIKAKIDANKYGKRPPEGVRYLLKGRIFCGCCGHRMTSFTGTSKSGVVSRYYKCHKNTSCPQKHSYNKDLLEKAIAAALHDALGSEHNIRFLAAKILEIHNAALGDRSALRQAEKELRRIDTALSNLTDAIEKGLLTETTKTRLFELESRKKALLERIVAESEKSVPELSEAQIIRYLTHALSSSTEAMIDLLVQKVVVTNDVIMIYLRYDDSDPPYDPGENGYLKHFKHPKRILSERGVLLSLTDVCLPIQRSKCSRSTRHDITTICRFSCQIRV